jgi:hypothetical protein
MAIKLGMNCKAYFGTAGSTAATLIDNIKNVSINLETAEADVTTRGNNGWRATVGTLKDGTVEFEMVWNTADPAFVAIKGAWFNATALALAFFDGVPGTGAASGIDADYSITNFSRTENLEEAVMVNVTAKPTYSTRAPTWWDAT